MAREEKGKPRTAAAGLCARQACSGGCEAVKWKAVSSVPAARAPLLACLLVGSLACAAPPPRSAIEVPIVAASADREPAQLGADAKQHLPSDCDLYVLVDWARLMSDSGFKLHLLPRIRKAFEHIDTGGALDRVLERTRIDMSSVKSLALCAEVGEPQSAIVVVGGTFKPSGFVEAMAAEASGDGAEIVSLDGVKSFRRDGSVLGQYGDGVIAFSSSAGMFREARNPTPAHVLDHLQSRADVQMHVRRHALRSSQKHIPEAIDVDAIISVDLEVDTSARALGMRVEARSPEAAESLGEALTKLRSEHQQEGGPLAPLWRFVQWETARTMFKDGVTRTRADKGKDGSARLVARLTLPEELWSIGLERFAVGIDEGIAEGRSEAEDP